MKHLYITLCLLLFPRAGTAQPHLVGYWQNWNIAQAPYIPLDGVDERYSVVNVSFAVPRAGTKYDMQFIPCCGETIASLRNRIANLQARGVTVNISIGGGNDPVELLNDTQRDIFVSSMNTILSDYGFDGIDVDLEGSSFTVTGGTITNPTDIKAINMIAALEQLLVDYQSNNGRKMFLSTAPETAFVQGGQSAWNGVWGAYLPLIDALRDDWDLVHVQLYNSGSMYGIDGGIYTQGTADFIVSQTEAIIQGFNVDRWNNQAGSFVGLPEDIIGVGLPACPSAAGGGFTAPATVKAAIDYLLGQGPKPGSYTLQGGPYPNLGGMMTWSMNWDNSTTCNGSAGEFASNYEAIFGNQLPLQLLTFSGRSENKSHVLNWTTTSEENFDRFVVEQASAPEAYWRELGAVAGAGQVLERSQYNYTINDPVGSAYYRLRLVNSDRSFDYSNVVYLESAQDDSYAAYPNPAPGNFNIPLPPSATEATISLSNTTGQVVLRQNSTATNSVVQVNTGLPPGIYVLTVRTAKTQYQQKIILQ